MRSRGAAGEVEDAKLFALDALRALTNTPPPCTMTSVDRSDSEMNPARNSVHPVFLEWYELLWERP